MKILLLVLAFINGGYMLVDGLYVMLKGKYSGPADPGPWAELFYRFDINVFKLGPLFIAFGIAWLVFVVGVITGQSWAYTLGLVASIGSLWYLPAGTLFSIGVLLLLIFARMKLGI